LGPAAVHELTELFVSGSVHGHLLHLHRPRQSPEGLHAVQRWRMGKLRISW
jgi:hypothetical protein